MSWIDVGPLSGLPMRGARVLKIFGRDIAVFRTSSDEVFALSDRCPHRGGPLSQGIVHSACVTCPLHDWVIDLATGSATGADEGSTPTFTVRLETGRVLVDVPEPSTVEAGLDGPEPNDPARGRQALRPLAVFERG